jgi:seryl-tRNA synthetase
MSVKDMAEAHLRNVQQQIGELQEQQGRIEADIQKLSQYLQQGVSELNNVNQPAVPEPAMDSRQIEDKVQIPSLSLPPSAKR